MRKARKVQRVMGWLLSRQLRVPGVGFSMSAASIECRSSVSLFPSAAVFTVIVNV